jgi:signal transduction histidine kinase/CheY-like chemotaxis protein
MKSLLVMAQHPELADSLRQGLNPEQFRVIPRYALDEAEPLLSHGLVEACILDLELTNLKGVWSLERVRRVAPNCPIIVYVNSTQHEWEEQAYLQGATHVLTKPVRPRMLSAVLERLRPCATKRTFAAPAQIEFSKTKPEPETPTAGTAQPNQTLTILRNFSSILTHSLDADAMLKEFLLLLREILSVNRAAIFLRPTLESLATVQDDENRRLRAAYAVGISAGLLEHFELSSEAGIGAYLVRSGRILRRESEAARQDVEIQKEFELLGAQVAVPILNRETIVGVAVFDGRVTGEALSNSELQLVFHLLEQLGLALKNIWLHDQVAANHEMLTGVMRELSSACVVVGRDLAILHANKMARRYFAAPDRRTGDPEFSDLPPLLGKKLNDVLKTGTGVSNFRYEPEQAPGTVFNINIVPFQRLPDGLPASALLMAEDLSQSEQLRRLEVQASNARLIETMAERLTNEIGNALVPLTVHQQLLAEKMAEHSVDQDSLKMLDRDLSESLRRIGRSNNQMKYLARNSLVQSDSFSVGTIIEEAIQDARRHLPLKSATITWAAPDKHTSLNGDRAMLKHAFAELILNGLQGNPTEPKVEIRMRAEQGPPGKDAFVIDIEDNGPGFTPEMARRGCEPFVKTRVVGLGLGLTVSQRAIEMHGGRLEILLPKGAQAGCVRVKLPLVKKP